jgi:SAM-dependent methyltransferase
MSFNYGYLLDLAASEHPGEPILDYGCGVGQAVALGLSRGQDIRGVDTFDGMWTGWRDSVPAEARGRVGMMESGRAPFADRSFGVIFANQVLEHVKDLAPVLRDIDRLLRPGGTLYASLPVRETWFEPHVGLYFAHWCHGTLRRTYLRTAYELRLGRYRELPKAEWVARCERTMTESTFYHRTDDLHRQLERVFGGPIIDRSTHHLRARLARFGPLVDRAPDWLLRIVFRVRGGVFLSIRKGG